MVRRYRPHCEGKERRGDFTFFCADDFSRSMIQLLLIIFWTSCVLCRPIPGPVTEDENKEKALTYMENKFSLGIKEGQELVSKYPPCVKYETYNMGLQINVLPAVFHCRLLISCFY